ncbi:hypothetical protein ANCDUO_14816 [Ancylostoma duodenale]|uniref:Uncharacterized protein n=1 Tax=Ancylostoma duodenale TaxID=51022 RepID=A0A0C2G265_9BILA|nr:hypothetical protein ANCDUO_14816 [Ancylostoma duodenale]
MRKNELERVVKVNGVREPVRVADFVIEEGELKMYREDGSLVGATIKNVKQEGHLRFECLDGCLMDAKLSDIKDSCFPGAFANRSDINLATKIRFYRQGAICLDEAALTPVLRLAYERCTAWTEFVCENEGIKKHENVEKSVVEKMYDAALQALKEDLEEETKQARPEKDGPLGFAAPESASALENDGTKGGIHTAVVRNFMESREKPNEWRSYGTWVITWPVDENWTAEKIKEICSACAQHLTEGGKIPNMLGESRTVDQTLARYARRDQFFATSSAIVMDNKIFAEVGSPESSIQFYSKYADVGNARYLYENVRLRVPSLQLPQMYAPPRTSVSRRGGMSWDEDQATPPKRSNHF